MIDHDQNYKTSLDTFLEPFVKAFAPDLSEEIVGFSDIPVETQGFTDTLSPRMFLLGWRRRV